MAPVTDRFRAELLKQERQLRRLVQFVIDSLISDLVAFALSYRNLPEGKERTETVLPADVRSRGRG